MYTLVSATLKKRGNNTTWKKVDISNLLFNDLMKDYISGYITVTSPFLYHAIHVDINDIRSNPIYPTINLKIPLWLQAVGNNTMVGSEVEPTLEHRYVHAGDAFHCGFDVMRTLTGAIDNVNLPNDMMTNIRLSKPIVDLNVLTKRTLVTVNGLLHIHTPLDDAILIQDGAVSLDISKQNHVGVISFESVSDLAMVSIQQSMIGKAVSNYDLADGIFIHLGKSLVNKTVMLSVAGFIQFTSTTFSIINEELGIIKFNPRKIDITKLLSIASKFIDISGIGLTVSPSYPDVFVKDEVYSDRALTNLLLLSQSFAIIVDKPNLSTEKYLLEDIGIRGVYEHYRAAIFPAMDAYGRMPEYVCIKSDLNYQVQVHDGEYGIAMHSRGEHDPENVVNFKTMDGDYRNMPLYLLEMCFSTYTP